MPEHLLLSVLAFVALAPSAAALLQAEGIPEPPGRTCDGRLEDERGEWRPRTNRSLALRAQVTSQCPERSTEEYVRTSACRLIDPSSVIVKLYNMQLPIYSFGDSLSRMRLVAMHHLAQANGLRLEKFQWVRFDCMTALPEILDFPRNSVLLINSGLHYNLDCKSSDDCEFDLQTISDLRDAGWPWTSENWTGTPCNTGPSANTGTLRGYVEDLVGFVRYLRDNRERLPRYTYWVESTPQHWAGSSTFHGTLYPAWKYQCANPPAAAVARHLHTWRNDISRMVWEDLKPGIPYIHVQEPLLSRAQDHKRKTKWLDCSHFCEPSAAQEDHVAYVLTSALTHIQRSQSL